MSKSLIAALGKQPQPEWGPIDPIELFRTLKIRAGSEVKELWAPQADALREWHAVRASSDVLFHLNTGAGKTLIGLVAAQSLVNETRGRVVYCCSTKQLVEQTREKAFSLGIATAGYVDSEWSEPDVFRGARGPLVTTYAALLNGRSVFRNELFAGVVLDDAHTAHDLVRSAFTLDIERQYHQGVYDSVTERLQGALARTGRTAVFDAVVSGLDASSVLMLPMFEMPSYVEPLRQVLLANDVHADKRLMFAWGHLSEHLDCCAIFVNHQRVHITPLLPAIRQVPAFRDGVRRLYLSATLRVDEELMRTFGRMPEHVIAPGGRAGEAERLVLLPPVDASDAEAREWAEATTSGTKAAIMVPSWPAAEPWRASSEVFGGGEGNDRVRRFAESRDEHLVFVARYDGIDLPGDDWRVLITDGRPTGMPLIDRFFEQHLERKGMTGSKVASRFVQLLGRTSRGMSDYGVVLIVGSRLLDWCMLPAHRALLPAHLQKQLLLGERLSRLSDFSSRDLLEKCLAQDDDWTAVYEQGMREAREEPAPHTDIVEKLSEVAVAEKRAASALWDRRYEEAAAILRGAKDKAFELDQNLGAWFLHWLGYSLQQAGDTVAATEHFQRAGALKRDLGMPVDGASRGPAEAADAARPQAQRMAVLLQKKGIVGCREALGGVAQVLLNGTATAAQHEEAIARLGEYLGLMSSRPEAETNGKGPDVLWSMPEDHVVVLFDAKTKKVNASYNKELIGLSAQHALWGAERYPEALRSHFIVGPRVPCTAQATPPSGLRVLAAAELARVAGDLRAVYERASTRGLPLFYAAEIQVGLDELGFLSKQIVDSLESVRLDAL